MGISGGGEGSFDKGQADEQVLDQRLSSFARGFAMS